MNVTRGTDGGFGASGSTWTGRAMALVGGSRGPKVAPNVLRLVSVVTTVSQSVSLGARA